MKKLLTLFFAFVFVYTTKAQQRILYVDNTPTAPTGTHVYTSLQAAINASQPNDIIHVKPSATSYGTITITNAYDSITIFGIGYNAEKEISQTSIIDGITLSGYNIKVSGLRITSTVFLANANASGNLSFENNIFDGTVYVGWGHAVSNVLFRNNIFYGFIQTYAARTNTTVFNNCIFSYNTTATNGQVDAFNGTLFAHCLFFGVGGSNVRNTFQESQNSTISNCIFYGRSPKSSVVNGISNTSYNNCYAVDSYDNNFPEGNGNSVNGTLTEIGGNIFNDPTIILQQAWNRRWNPALDPNSIELLEGGDNGTAVGLTGGTIPYKYTGAPLPYIKSFVVPSVIRRGDNLNVKAEATSN